MGKVVIRLCTLGTQAWVSDSLQRSSSQNCFSGCKLMQEAKLRLLPCSLPEAEAAPRLLPHTLPFPESQSQEAELARDTDH